MICRIVLFLSISLANSSVVFAQKEYAKIILDSLCSDNYQGRGYVNNGDNRAADFIVDELKNIGVQPFKNKSFEQHYSFNVNTFPYPIHVVLDKDTLVPGQDYLVQPFSGSAQGNFELVEINSGNISSVYNNAVDLSKKERAQKLYAFNFTTITNSDNKKALYKSAIQATRYFPIIWVETNKQMYSVGRFSSNYPLITIDSAKYQTAKLVDLKINNSYKPKYETKNIIGYLPGKKKRKFIVLSAHYDHLGMMGENTMFPGANDNASGVAMLLSMAKYFKANPTDYSIALCFFSGEEAGLEGSKYFIAHPYFKLRKVNFVLNIDIMGGASDGITVVNGTEHNAAFNELVSINQEHNYLNLVKKRGPTSNSDHYFFTQAGVPAFFLYANGNVKNYHDIYDTAENTPLDKFDEVQSLLINFIERR